MEFFTDFFLPVVYAFFSAMAFAFLYKVRGIEMFFTSLGGGIGWLFYLLVMFAFRFETDVAACPSNSTSSTAESHRNSTFSAAISGA